MERKKKKKDIKAWTEIYFFELILVEFYALSL
jgi:hypothetical protein